MAVQQKGPAAVMPLERGNHIGAAVIIAGNRNRGRVFLEGLPVGLRFGIQTTAQTASPGLGNFTA